MQKADKETGRPGADRAAALGRLADRRRLPRPHERPARGAADRAAQARREAHRRQEHAHPAGGARRPAPTRCSRCSKGPTAIAFVEADGNPVAVAKALSDAARETKILALRGGVLSGKTITGAEVESLAKLPPLDVLQAQLVGRDRRPADAARRGAERARCRTSSA